MEILFDLQNEVDNHGIHSSLAAKVTNLHASLEAKEKVLYEKVSWVEK